jgi:para-nitrobenzyl esterase
MKARLLLAGGAALIACAQAIAAPSLTRQTQYGPVVGLDESASKGTHAWKGVPFAAAPVGALRWSAPVDPPAWKTPRNAQQFGPACVQYGRIYGPGANNRHDPTIATTLGQAVGSEDCLTLNIWRPADRRGGLPVIVFVHGGSNVSGYTADPVYDGAALAKAADAVVVTVNYRLGIFGFLRQAALRSAADPEGASGNFALLDIVQALRFVQRNIAQFGGQPQNVTLMGQSAGAVNVYALLTTPATVSAHPRLFHRAVPLSGGISLASNLPPGRLPTLNPAAVYDAQGAALLHQQLIVDGLAADVAGAAAYAASQGDAAMAAYLRGKSPATLLFTLLTRLAPLGLAGSGPIPDGTVLPLDPVGAIAAGQYTRVPVLAGNTRDEGKLFPTLLAALGLPSGRLVSDAQLFNIQFAYNPDAAPQVTIEQWIPGVYLPVDKPNGFNALTELYFNQLFFVASRDNVLNALKAQQPDVWAYRFDWDEEPAPFDDIYGAAHAFDLPFVFGNFGPSLFAHVIASQANAPGRLALSRAMMASLGAFARGGDPNAPAALGIEWPTWPAVLRFDATPAQTAISLQP